jgi:hypothetical protein
VQDYHSDNSNSAVSDDSSEVGGEVNESSDDGINEPVEQESISSSDDGIDEPVEESIPTPSPPARLTRTQRAQRRAAGH